MTRDRMAELKACQQGEDEFEMLEVQLSLEVDDGFMADFATEVGELQDLVNQLDEDTKLVQVTHSKILSTPGTNEKLELELEGLTAGIKRTSQQVRFRLKAIELGIERGEEVSESAAEIRIKKIQHSTLLKRFLESMTEYNKAQTDFRQNCIKKIQRQAEIGGKYLAEEEVENLLESGNVAILTEGIEIDLTEGKALLSDIEARHQDIINLETSVKELHDLFVDIAVLVDAQGEMIDRIEVQVTDAVEWVDRANADMKKAREFQAKARRKKLMMIVAGSIASIFVGKYLQAKLGM